jgi:hypothetical protein
MQSATGLFLMLFVDSVIGDLVEDQVRVIAATV